MQYVRHLKYMKHYTLTVPCAYKELDTIFLLQCLVPVRTVMFIFANCTLAYKTSDCSVCCMLVLYMGCTLVSASTAKMRYAACMCMRVMHGNTDCSKLDGTLMLHFLHGYSPHANKNSVLRNRSITLLHIPLILTCRLDLLRSVQCP